MMKGIVKVGIGVFLTALFLLPSKAAHSVTFTGQVTSESGWIRLQEETAWAGSQRWCNGRTWAYVFTYTGVGQTATLWAGQTMEVGTVTVSGSNGSELTLTLQTVGDWCIEEIHAYVGRRPPTTKSGNLVPGQFPVNTGLLEPLTSECTITVPINSGGCGPIIVAVHAVVYQVQMADPVSVAGLTVNFFNISYYGEPKYASTTTDENGQYSHHAEWQDAGFYANTLIWLSDQQGTVVPLPTPPAVVGSDDDLYAEAMAYYNSLYPGAPLPPSAATIFCPNVWIFDVDGNVNPDRITEFPNNDFQIIQIEEEETPDAGDGDSGHDCGGSGHGHEDQGGQGGHGHGAFSWGTRGHASHR